MSHRNYKYPCYIYKEILILYINVRRNMDRFNNYKLFELFK